MMDFESRYDRPLNLANIREEAVRATASEEIALVTLFELVSNGNIDADLVQRTYRAHKEIQLSDSSVSGLATRFDLPEERVRQLVNEGTRAAEIAISSRERLGGQS